MKDRDTTSNHPDPEIAAEIEADARAALTAAIDAGLVVRAEELREAEAERDAAERVVEAVEAWRDGSDRENLIAALEAHRSAYPADQGGDRG